MKTKLIIAAVVAGLAATSVSAAGFGRGDMAGPMGGGMMPAPLDFASLDTDGNGTLTLEELQAMSAAKFAEADADGSGTLSQDEVAAMVTAQMALMAANRAQMMIAERDTDGDGLLSAEELQPNSGQGLAMMFARLDTDADGSVTAEEFQTAQAQMGQRMQRGGEGFGDQGRGGFFGRHNR